MNRFLIAAIVCFSLLGCANSNIIKSNTAGFTSLLIGYSNGWNFEASYYVDSSFLLFKPIDSATILYTELENSVQKEINIFLKKTEFNSIKDHPNCCCDCEVLTYEFIKGHDTLSVIQADTIDTNLRNLFTTLDQYSRKAIFRKLNSNLFQETRFTPPVKPQVKFIKPTLK